VSTGAGDMTDGGWPLLAARWLSAARFVNKSTLSCFEEHCGERSGERGYSCWGGQGGAQAGNGGASRAWNAGERETGLSRAGPSQLGLGWDRLGAGWGRPRAIPSGQ
jgi:hypothetical protein